MLEMKVLLREIVGTTKIDRIRSQQIRESCGTRPNNEWVERIRRREWDEHVTRMDVERLVRSQGILYLLEEVLQDAIKADDGATYSPIKTGGIAYNNKEEE